MMMHEIKIDVDEMTGILCFTTFMGDAVPEALGLPGAASKCQGQVLSAFFL